MSNYNSIRDIESNSGTKDNASYNMCNEVSQEDAKQNEYQSTHARIYQPIVPQQSVLNVSRPSYSVDSNGQLVDSNRLSIRNQDLSRINNSVQNLPLANNHQLLAGPLSNNSEKKLANVEDDEEFNSNYDFAISSTTSIRDIPRMLQAKKDTIRKLDSEVHDVEGYIDCAEVKVLQKPAVDVFNIHTCIIRPMNEKIFDALTEGKSESDTPMVFYILPTRSGRIAKPYENDKSCAIIQNNKLKIYNSYGKEIFDCKDSFYPNHTILIDGKNTVLGIVVQLIHDKFTEMIQVWKAQYKEISDKFKN